MRYRSGCVYVWGVVPQPGVSTRLHQVLMATTLVLGLSLVPVLAAAGPFREVVVFGDSLSDSGNVWAATKAVTVDARVAPHTSASKPCLRVSPHTAPQLLNPCHGYIAFVQ